MIIKNKRTGKKYPVSKEDWEMMQEKKLENGEPGQTYAKLFKVIDDSDNMVIESDSKEGNVPSELLASTKPKSQIVKPNPKKDLDF